MKEVRIGVAGLGHRGIWWLQQLSRIPGYRITAVCDRIEAIHAKALEVVPYRNDVKRFTDYGEFLKFNDMDAVGLVVRCKEQGAMAAQALEAGKHVNSEVPAAHTIEDCWRIVRAAKSSGKVYQLAEQVRYAGFVQAWRELVTQGKFGTVTYAEGQYIGYYGTKHFFQDMKTGRLCSIQDLPAFPQAKATWFQLMQPIHYLVHDLSPMMKILDDRPVQVVGMGTQTPSLSHPEVNQADMQVALIKTAKGAVLRLAASFTQPGPIDDHHWWRFIGTRGRVEWRRSKTEKPVMWFADGQMHEYGTADWRFERTDAPDGAIGSGHSDLDYYVQASFRDAILHGKKIELDAYMAAEIAAAGILAAESIDRGSEPMAIPDFRSRDAASAGTRKVKTRAKGGRKAK